MAIAAQASANADQDVGEVGVRAADRERDGRDQRPDDGQPGQRDPAQRMAVELAEAAEEELAPSEIANTLAP